MGVCMHRHLGKEMVLVVPHKLHPLMGQTHFLLSVFRHIVKQQQNKICAIADLIP